MEKDEKVQFILEQMRLCLATKDFIRTQIISKKISTKFFVNETDQVQVTPVHHNNHCDVVIISYSYLLQELKLKYYNLMIELCHHDHNYLAICQHYRAIFDTPQVQEDENRWKAVGDTIYVLLSFEVDPSCCYV